MTLAVGKKVIYPRQGLCLVNSIVNTIVDEKPIKFYQLVVLDEGGGNLLIPADKVNKVGIRPLVNPPEIPRLLNRLKRRSTTSVDRKQRTQDNLKLLRSGSAFGLAEIVESLTELTETKPLSYGERDMLDRAKRLLVCEISEVTGATREDAEKLIDQALIERSSAGSPRV